jgi:hypothetical protein
MLDKYISIDEKAKEDLKPKEEQIKELDKMIVISNEAKALTEAILQLSADIRRSSNG